MNEHVMISLPEKLMIKYDNLRELLRGMGSMVIAYSGGVDSTLLIKAAYECLGNDVLAVIARSETYPEAEYKEACDIAEEIGVRYEIVYTEETDNIKFRENPVNRCYYCKVELFDKLREIAERDKIAWIADGTIVDDTGDFRPGMAAKKEAGVRSPLLESGLNKVEVRELSRALGLRTWEKQSFACLSSRFPYGQRIEKENLMKIDRAETFIREKGFREFRVRHHDKRTVRIEVGAGEIKRFADDRFRREVVSFFKDLGFTYVTLDLMGFRSGSMNEILK